MAFSTRAGESLDEDDAQRGTAISGSATRVSKRLREDENIYGLGEKNGPLNKRGWKQGGFSFTMWNSDTYGYEASTDPIYVSVPFYISMRKGVAFGVFLDNTFRSNFDIGHQTQNVLSFGAEGGVTSAILNAVVAEDLPGPGTVFLHVNWSFKAPVRPGDTITGFAEVIEVRSDKPVTKLRTRVTRGDGTVVLEGDAVCYTMPMGRTY